MYVYIHIYLIDIYIYIYICERCTWTCVGPRMASARMVSGLGVLWAAKLLTGS